MADLTQFDLGSAARVARVVRQVEGQGPRARPLTFETVEPPRSPGRVAKPVASVMPGSTAVFGIYTGTIGMEVFSGTYVTAYSRHASLTPQNYVTLSKGEVSEGGHQIRQSYGLSQPWKLGFNRGIAFAGGGTAVVLNNYANLDADTSLSLSFSYTQNDSGQADWSLIAASRKSVSIATFTGSWANNTFKTVTLAPSLATASVLNRYDDFVSEQPSNENATEVCLVAHDGTDWQLAEKKSSPVVLEARYSGEWNINQTKTVTLANQSVPPDTVVATNLTFHLPDIGLTSQFACLIAKQGSTWFLTSAIQHNTKRGTFVGPWGKGGSKTVSLIGGGSVQAINRHANIDATGTRQCTVARDGMSWELIAAEC
jgi:hypothetical protein